MITNFTPQSTNAKQTGGANMPLTVLEISKTFSSFTTFFKPQPAVSAKVFNVFRHVTYLQQTTPTCGY
jgi:hypothetical protein